MAFEYDPALGEVYEHESVATIGGTGRSSSTVVAVCQEMSRVEISGHALWDYNFNGAYDEGDVPISSTVVHLYWYNEETGWWELVAATYSGRDGLYTFKERATTRS